MTSITLQPDSEVADTTSPTTPEPLGPALLSSLDLEAILLENPTSGGGTLQKLSWSSVEGVDRFDIFVFGTGGDLYWSWSTPKTSVFIGGIETQNLNAPGPRILPGMTWSVLGFDATDVLVAQSEVRAISP